MSICDASYVKEEEEANKMTKEEQIGRLLRPGYTYRLAILFPILNNPFVEANIFNKLAQTRLYIQVGYLDESIGLYKWVVQYWKHGIIEI